MEEISFTDLRLGRRFDEIMERGVLRVGYRPKNLPCTYLNEDGQVVGFDADMAHSLARDMGEDGHAGVAQHCQLDIAMSCIASLPDRYTRAAFSRPYLDLNMALVMPDYMRHMVLTDGDQLDEISFALVSSHYFRDRLRERIPGATFVEIESAESFFTDPPPADALLLTAEEGAAYAYRYPHYTVVLPGQSVRVPAAYALPRGESEWQEVVGNWVQLKRADGSIDRLYRYWMKGGATERKQRRWSVVQDVLGWVD